MLTLIAFAANSVLCRLALDNNSIDQIVLTTQEIFMTSVLYASLAALLIFWLSLNVINKRRKHRVSIGDAGINELKLAIVAQNNAVEYFPIALILLFALEYNKASLLLVHASGIALMTGRLIHARAILSDNLKKRVLGMQITLYAIIALALINFVYLPYEILYK